MSQSFNNEYNNKLNSLTELIKLHPEWTELEWERFFNSTSRFMSGVPTGPSGK